MQGEVKKELQDNIGPLESLCDGKARVDPGTLAGPTGSEATRWGEICRAERRKCQRKGKWVRSVSGLPSFAADY